jgi:hypothetical protein
LRAGAKSNVACVAAEQRGRLVDIAGGCVPRREASAFLVGEGPLLHRACAGDDRAVGIDDGPAVEDKIGWLEPAAVGRLDGGE